MSATCHLCTEFESVTFMSRVTAKLLQNHFHENGEKSLSGSQKSSILRGKFMIFESSNSKFRIRIFVKDLAILN